LGVRRHGVELSRPRAGDHPRPPRRAGPRRDCLVPTCPPRVGAVLAGPSVAGCENLGELCLGGMGVVYKARQPGLKRPVALRMILAGPHAGTAHQDRVRAEAVGQCWPQQMVSRGDLALQSGGPMPP
jgi:hypothetical protein